MHVHKCCIASAIHDQRQKTKHVGLPTNAFMHMCLAYKYIHTQRYTHISNEWSMQQINVKGKGLMTCFWVRGERGGHTLAVDTEDVER